MKRLLIYIMVIFSFPLGMMGQVPEGYYQEAADNSPALQAAFADYRSAVEASNSVAGLPSPEISLGWFIQPIETRVGPQRARISVMQMFPWKGALSSQNERAAYIAKAKYEAFALQKAQLFLQIQEVYAAIWESQRMIEILEGHIDLLAAREGIATQKMETGKGSLADVLRIQMEKEVIQTDIANRQATQRSLAFELNTLLHPGEFSPINPPKDSILHLTSLTSLADWEVRETGESYQVNSLRFQERAILSDLDRIAANGRPTFGVGVSYFLTGQREGVAIEGNGRDALMASVSVQIPIYRKPFSAKIEAKHYESTALRFEQEAVLAELSIRENKAVTQYKNARRSLENLQRQIATANQTGRILLDAYTVDTKNFEDLLQIERMVLEMQLKKVAAQAQMEVALARLNALYITE